MLTRGFDLPENDARARFEDEFNPRCQPLWSRRELAHKLKTARQDGRVPLGYLLQNEIKPWHNHVTEPEKKRNDDKDSYEAEERIGIQEESEKDPTPRRDRSSHAKGRVAT